MWVSDVWKIRRGCRQATWVPGVSSHQALVDIAILLKYIVNVNFVLSPFQLLQEAP